MSASEELASYKLQYQQVEAALLKDADNDELLKLKADLEEVIALQEELLSAEAIANPSSSKDPNAPVIKWKIGDKVLATSTNGKDYPAIIEGISGSNVAITFLSNRKQHTCTVNELKLYTESSVERGIFEGALKGGPKKEWQAERERRRLKNLKKVEKKKELEQAKEGEKNSWLKFNNKATNKGLKGLKRVVATGSAPDGPSSGMKRDNEVSSRRDQFAFRQTQRGNMESLF